MGWQQVNTLAIIGAGVVELAGIHDALKENEHTAYIFDCAELGPESDTIASLNDHNPPIDEMRDFLQELSRQWPEVTFENYWRDEASHEFGVFYFKDGQRQQEPGDESYPPCTLREKVRDLFSTDHLVELHGDDSDKLEAACNYLNADLKLHGITHYTIDRGKLAAALEERRG